MVPFAPDGTSDVLARGIGQKLTAMWGQPMVIENKPGAGGNIGTETVARAQPDGYTLLMIDVGTLTISPSVVLPRLAYDPVKDLAPVTTVAFSPHALVHPLVPANTVAEFIAYAKANPGIDILIQLAGEQFKTITGITMTQAPYKGGASAGGGDGL